MTMDLPTLPDIAPADRARVGGKALQLALLARRGLPVPAGFVVPTYVFRQVLADAGLLADAERLAKEPTAAACEALHRAVRTIAMPADLVEALRDAAARLEGRVAVRSSAVDEDGRRRSFAGQHLTMLNVTASGLVSAVRECWASLYRRESFAYRSKTGRGPAAAGMAVLVQRMVEPVASGVLFTINPLNGSWREMTVESTWGLGEALMSGHVTPHWYLVRRPRRLPRTVHRAWRRLRPPGEGRLSRWRARIEPPGGLPHVGLVLVQQDTPEIAEQWVCDARGDVVREPVPPTRQGRPTLDPDTLFRVCRLGLRVEAMLGEPQDVEWALTADGEVHLLQARPITTAGPARPREDVLWTRRFIGERWPEPATPLGWSLLAPIFEWFIAYPETQVRHLGGGPALRLYRSRPYINATVFRHLAFKLPGSPPPRFMTELVPPEEERDWQRRFAMLPGLSVYGSIFRETFAERRWRRFRWNPFTNHRRWEEFRERLEAELPGVSRPPVSERDAIALVDRQLALVRDYVGVHITSLLFANLFYQLLEAALAAWLPADATRSMERLATCPEGNLTLETNEALWSLAWVATDADCEALADGRPLSEPFRGALERFLDRYGHRSTASWEIFSPRWAQHPEILAPLLRAHRHAGAEQPLARARRQREAYEAAIAEVEAAVTSPVRRATLRRLVGYTRAYLLLRENQRFWFDRLLFSMQRTLLDLGARFSAKGWLAEAGDVAFLTAEEIRGLADGTLAPDPVREWVDRRRAQRAADTLEVPPVFLRGDEAVADTATGARLQGLGISPGRARGRVRVLRTPAEGHRLQPGEVLVTHAVDPGWTPLFLHAGAVILEMGSRLSHGAVVAREYGLPAVVNIEGVTRMLRDGQEVTVDGTRGVVWLHP